MVEDLKKWYSFNFLIKTRVLNKIDNTSNNSKYFYIKKRLYLGQNLIQKYNVVRCIRNFRLLVLRQWGLFSDNDSCESQSSTNLNINNFIKRYNIYKQFVNMEYHAINNLTEKGNYFYLNESLEKNKIKEISAINGANFDWCMAYSKTNWSFYRGSYTKKLNGVKFQNGRLRYINTYSIPIGENEITHSGITNRPITHNQITHNGITNSQIIQKTDTRRIFLSSNNWSTIKSGASYKWNSDEEVSDIKLLTKGQVYRYEAKDNVDDKVVAKVSTKGNLEMMMPDSRKLDTNRAYDESYDVKIKHARAHLNYIDVTKTNYNEITGEKLQKVTGFKNTELLSLPNLYSEAKSKSINNIYINSLNNALNTNTLEVSRAKLFKNLIKIQKDDFIGSIVYVNENNVEKRNKEFYNKNKTSLYTHSETLILYKPVIKEMPEDEKMKTPEKLVGDTASSIDFNEKGTKQQKQKELENEEINILADKIYKVLERRIAIQKDKRGVW